MARPNSGVSAVQRALTVLGAFRDGDGSLTLHELAARTGYYKSTILRLLASLGQSGCVLRLADGSYQLGPMVLHWGRVYLSSLRVEDHVRPVLERIAAETGESATYYTRQGDVRLCVARVDSSYSIRDHVKVGDILPLDKGSGGHVLRAFDPSSSRGKVKPRSFVVTSFRERDAQGAGMSAPVFGPGGTLRGAISISGPLGRFGDAVLPKLSKAVLAAAAELTTRLGGDAGPLRKGRP
jgi:DNA-binding IclR family transcriptional regulator